jgi:mannose-1-phosphate guanylyltransferase
MSGPIASPDASPHDWALVLAGGRGKRIAHLTVIETGESVPKQFCSLGHGPSLVHEALRRARAVSPPERTLVTVTEEHESWWRNLRDVVPQDNLLVQPEQRGTGIGILHPLLEVLKRDAAASLAVLPADHYFGDESAIAGGLRMAMKLTRRHPALIFLLGFEPEDLDADLGYIVPAASQDEGVCGVCRFVEKPGAERVRALLDAGALCNSFILAASGRALLSLFERHCPSVVARLHEFVHARPAPGSRHAALTHLFREIPSIDFSQDVISADVAPLRVLRLRACGWSDLGTPSRLARVLRRHRTAIDRTPVAPAGTRGRVDLATRSGVDQREPASMASSLRS